MDYGLLTFRNMFLEMIIALIFLVVEFIVGITANGLMIVVNCSEWIRSRKLTCCDMILTSLGISRLFLQCMIFINNFLFAIFYVLWTYLNILSLWFATWLSVFYCVKIANFSHPLFLWLKCRISGLMPQLLMGSLLVSLVSCLPSVYTFQENYTGNSTNILFGNTTVECTYRGHLSSGLTVMAMLGYSFPFFIFIVAALLLITSLWRHNKRMEKHASSSRDTIAKAHVSAVKGLISFIFFYISYFVIGVLLLSDILTKSSLRLTWALVVVMTAYPSVHTVVLILSNPKLKRVAGKCLLIIS
uniref:Taste receptor type 2 n=1 Tax=Pelusios castaneus TaxID=367368 RepID=A0A8C8VED3_9SAUR